MKQFVFATVFALSSIAAAQPSGGAKAAKDEAEVTAEQRSKMASVHEKMAACLRSTKPISECRDEMHGQCEESMGKDECPMMGDMMGHGKRHMREMMKSKRGDKTK